MRRSLRANAAVIRTLAGSLLAAGLATACGSSGTTFTTPSTSARCGVTTTASGSTLAPAGGAVSIAVSTERECQWTATSDTAWLKIMAGSSGQGPGTVELDASANAGAAARTAAVTVNDQRIQVTQAAPDCQIDLSNTSTSISSSGGSGSVDVRSSNAACTWTASSEVSWITITSGTSGTGSGTVAFNVSATTATARSGTLKIAGLTFTVDQIAGCSYAIAPATFAAPAAGAGTTVTVSAGHDCAWSATSAASWIMLTPSSGSGNASVEVTVAPAGGAARTGTATIAGQTFTVTQSPSACTVAISPASASVDAAGGTGRIDVTAGAACGWAAASSASWLSVTSGASGTGNGAVAYSAAANTGPARTATISIADRAFTVTQSGACSASVTPDSIAVTAGAATSSVQITTAQGCAWTAASAAPWLSASPGGGSGAATVQLAIAANTGPSRTGTATIAGAIVTVTQETACRFTISPTQVDLGGGDANGTVAVKAPGGCAWTATSNAPWITITSGASGSGNASVKYTVAKNPKGSPARTGTLTIAGEVFTVRQKPG